MGRLGITREQVFDTANKLEASGTAATIRAVSTVLGKGSTTTIQGHLKDWRETRPKLAPAPLELPAEIVRAMNAWVLQEATAAKAAAENDLAAAREDVSHISDAVDLLEKECDALTDQSALLMTERDQAQGTARAQEVTIAALIQDVQRERDLAGKAQIAAAQAQLRADNQTEQLTEMKLALEKLTVAVDTQQQARIMAEKNAAVLTAQCESIRKAAGDDRARTVGMEKHLDAAHVKAEAMRADYETRLTEEAQATAAERAETAKERRAAHAAAVENARLKAQLDAFEHIEVSRKDAAMAPAHPTPDQQPN